MKAKSILWIGLVGIVGLSSCTDERIISQSTTINAIRVSGEDFANGDAATRAEYAVDGTGFHFSWTEGDTVGIYPVGGDQVAFPISSGEGSKTAQFDGGAWALRSTYSYAAYYPFSSDNYKAKETSIPVSYIGQVQNGNDSLDCLDKFDYQASVATRPDVDGNVNITLKHLGCFVRFQLTMPNADTYKSITLKSSNTPFVTSGTVDLTSDSIHITPVNTSQTISIELNSTSTTERDSVLVVYAMIAPVDMSDSKIIVSVIGSNDKTYASVLAGKKMVSGKAYNYKSAIIDGATITDEGQIVPPDNEIWYKTKDNKIIDYLGKNIFTAYDDIGLNGAPFDVNITDHLYDGNKCIIRCDGPITKVNNRCFSIDDPSKSTIIEIMLPNSIVELGRYCFNMADITEFRTPDNLEICTCPFINNPKLTKFTGKHADGHSIIINNVLCIYAPGANDESYVIPDGVIEIGTGAFDCARFRQVTIPNTVKKIGYDAFQRSSLETVTIPESVETIMDNAFDLCMNMKGYYGNTKFCSDDNLCFIKYSDYYDGTVLHAFAGHDIENYTIQEGIVAIRAMSFYYGGENLKSVTLPQSIKYVDAFAFKDCNNMEFLYGPNTTSDHKGYIDNNTVTLYLSKGLKEYTTTSDVLAIGNNLFEYNNTLEKITITDNVLSIGYDCFANCINLKTIILSAKLTTFPFYCFKRSYNVEAIYLRAKNPPLMQDWTCPGSFFPEKEYEKLKIYVPKESLILYENNESWAPFKKYLCGYEYTDLPEVDFYISSDYTNDGQSEQLFESSVGNGIDLILMGDAFSDRQIADGTYTNVMRSAQDAFFSEEPYKSFKDYFNVYSVNVVSATEGYDYSGQSLGTGFGDGTYVYGNDSKVIEYAKKVIPEDKIDDAVIIVMMNEDAYAGTCFMYDAPDGDYGRGTAIAYFPTNSIPDNFNGLVLHEAGGHGFAKLADEYAYEANGTISQDAINSTRSYEPYGWWKNVDFTNDATQVKWSTFISDSRYANENIGCYEGGLTYWSGVWRPTENSIMRYNTGGFNAPSRYAIWYRINKLAYGDSWNGTYEDFVEYDAINRTPSAVARRAQSRRNYVEKPLPQLAPPVVVGHSWREASSK